MNQEPSYAKLLDTVREAGGDVETMTAFAALVAAAEREACAKVCDELPAPDIYSDTDKSMWEVTCTDCGDAIRERGETK